MHRLIVHNLICLIKEHAFGLPPTDGVGDDAATPIVPMSHHKWRTLNYVADTLGISQYIAGTPASAHEYNVNDAQLFNHWTNKRYMQLRDEEMASETLSEDTLRLLDIIVMNADHIITHDVDIKGIIALGLHIQQHKATIDYEKLNNWLSRIGIIQLASFEGNMLVSALGFNADDIPFLVRRTKSRDKQARNHFIRCIDKALEKHSFGMSSRLGLAMNETLSHRFFSAISLVTDIEE